MDKGNLRFSIRLCFALICILLIFLYFANLTNGVNYKKSLDIDEFINQADKTIKDDNLEFDENTVKIRTSANYRISRNHDIYLDYKVVVCSANEDEDFYFDIHKGMVEELFIEEDRSIYMMPEVSEAYNRVNKIFNEYDTLVRLKVIVQYEKSDGTKIMEFDCEKETVKIY